MRILEGVIIMGLKYIGLFVAVLLGTGVCVSSADESTKASRNILVNGDFKSVDGDGNLVGWLIPTEGSKCFQAVGNGDDRVLSITSPAHAIKKECAIVRTISVQAEWLGLHISGVSAIHELAPSKSTKGDFMGGVGIK